jgi:signal transduction histidine kinase/ligand-binding sensor domain-containing protein/DNA-binding response OmpR family regulator
MKLSLRYISIKKYSAVLLLFLWLKGINAIDAATPKEQTTTRKPVEQTEEAAQRKQTVQKKYVPLTFRLLSTSDGLPTNEVQKVYQDKDGFIWFATRYGLCKYDGYGISVYTRQLNNPNSLSNNDILCLAEDHDHRLWIGTQDGLNVLNKKTGDIKKITIPGIPNPVVSCILVTSKNEIWLGLEEGLFTYFPKTNEFLYLNRNNSNGILTDSPVKSLLEDSYGDIWIGTWNKGLFRYDSKKQVFVAYPQMNERNSAHVIYEDSKKNIWVGTWDAGLQLLKNPRDPNKVTWQTFRNNPVDSLSLSDNIVYDICEDANRGALWIGTRSGLSILKYDHPERFINYKSTKSFYRIPCDEINSIIRDHENNMWIGSIGGGVFITNTEKTPFHTFSINIPQIPTATVRSLLVDRADNIWIGIGQYGLLYYDRRTHSFLHQSQIPEFKAMGYATISDILQRQNDEILFASYGNGLCSYRKGEPCRQLTPANSPFIKENRIISLYEDSRANCWIGTQTGVGVLFPDGSGFTFNELIVGEKNLSRCYVKDIIEDQNHDIWLATINYGLIRLSGNFSSMQNITCKNYCFEEQNISTNSVLSLHIDKFNRLWAGTENGGLFLYDKKTDTFIEKNPPHNILGDMVGSIEEDREGNLWLGTNKGLIKLSFNPRAELDSFRIYTTADGLQDNFFIPKSSFNHNGELFFGGYKGFIAFSPEHIKHSVVESPFFVTDIKIFNRSVAGMQEKERKKLLKQIPPYTRQLSIPHKYNNFTIEFASLSYRNPELTRYAYKLDGFDKEWQYTDSKRHFAYYNNLSPGNYTFLLKATSQNGIWNNEIQKISVKVLPPFWLTWWAFALYVVITVTIAYLIYLNMRNRIRLKNQLQLKQLEQAKAEELNQTKLQFFTNITHEFLTPLTIISASVDELKMTTPRTDDIFTIITQNITRLMRLFQQILEFRKAESGNLRLRVSYGNLSDFVRTKTESFRPLIKKKKLHLSVVSDPDPIYGYFDPDKIDKILYNLISNAAKYTPEDGFIQVNLSYKNGNRDYVLLSVKDNGCGISAEDQKNLFTRFYEGDYRKFNTTGTGIGLSLTKDLVNLHYGDIRVESEENKGCTFYLTFPIEKSYFNSSEIEEEEAAVIDKNYMKNPADSADVTAVDTSKNKLQAPTLLVVEDNEELLQLMVRLLGKEYNVLTAENGKEAIVIIENEPVELIISDIIMPEMDGIELCRFVKNTIEYSHIPIILLTAKNKEEDKAEAYESGADDFISKPFNLSVLYARIKNLLKNRERMAGDFKNQVFFELKDLNYTSIDQQFIQKAIECVYRHLDDVEFDQAQFVEEMGTSKSTLYNKLKSLTGLNTSAFIRNIRLKAACKIMEDTQNIRISELAYRVGFNDPKYFSSCFKKEFNMPPSEYMERFVLKNESQEES